MLKMYQQLFIGILFALLSDMAVSVSGSEFSGSKPSIIVVLMDDLGFSDLGCYGGEIDTQVLDKLAEAGFRFTRFTNSAKCTTSRYCHFNRKTETDTLSKALASLMLRVRLTQEQQLKTTTNEILYHHLIIGLGKLLA